MNTLPLSKQFSYRLDGIAEMLPSRVVALDASPLTTVYITDVHISIFDALVSRVVPEGGSVGIYWLVQTGPNLYHQLCLVTTWNKRLDYSFSVPIPIVDLLGQPVQNITIGTSGAGFASHFTLHLAGFKVSSSKEVCLLP